MCARRALKGGGVGLAGFSGGAGCGGASPGASAIEASGGFGFA
jgi:hypothetical protein